MAAARQACQRKRSRLVGGLSHDDYLESLSGCLCLPLFRHDNPAVPELPTFLETQTSAWPARVQDLPAGEQPPQIPFSEQITLACGLAEFVRDNMPSRVCAVCSECKSASEVRALQFSEIAGVELLRADMRRTAAVPRCAHVLYWRRVDRRDCKNPPDPVLPRGYKAAGGQSGNVGVVDTSAGEGSGETSSGLDDSTDDRPSRRRRCDIDRPPTYAPRVGVRLCDDNPVAVEVPYCMRAETVLPNRTMNVSADGVERFTVCSECIQALQGGRIPDGALAGWLDPGDVPPVNQHGHSLVPLTHLESLVVGLARPHMRLLVVRQPGTPSWRAVDTLPAALRGHTLAFPNNVPSELQRVVPYAPADLPSFIQVVLIDAVKDRADLEAKVRQAPCLKMRGLAIAAWAEWAVRVNPMAQVDHAALQQYRALGAEPTVPEPLVAHAVATDDPDTAAVMRAAFEGDRAGNARVRQQQDDVEAATEGANAAGGRSPGPGAGQEPAPSGRTPNIPVTGVFARPSPMAAALAVPGGTAGVVVSPAAALQPDGYIGPGVHMLGLDDVEVHHGGAYSTSDPLDDCTDPSAILQRLQQGGVVVSAAGGRGASNSASSPTLRISQLPSPLSVTTFSAHLQTHPHPNNSPTTATWSTPAT
ncbi:hypothetical protein Agub_g10808 [Astrephomene gubernaculifera]|uniref:DUF6570 domain-containing protein n=1 Tax=Astrephomene gubernaculifera TaxID=47775 RepID=A0AAD3DVH1_9CHLO|nr:hypothetical protein Agub_g10808 [Astrephomene gubernaculifera]